MQGYDLQFGTNVLGQQGSDTCECETDVENVGHFYFTKLLIPTLLHTAKSMPEWKPRIIHTSSVVSNWAGPLEYSTFIDGPARRSKGPRWLYTQSKLVRAESSQYIRLA